MASFAHQVTRRAFAALERVAPQAAGRLAFELFCRTANPDKPSPAERKAVERARDFMAEARHHRLTTRAGCVSAFDFRPPAGVERQGRVLVIHGWRSRTEHMRLLVEGLVAAGFRVISLDLPGHGRSAGRRLNMALAVDAVRVAADWLGPFDAMVGHSFGGAVAVNAAVGSIAGISPVETQRLVMIASPDSMPVLFRDVGRMLNLGPRSQQAMDARVKTIAGHPLEEYVCSNQLRALPIPTLVMHAQDDREVPAENAVSLAGAGRHVTLKWFPGLGHRRILAEPGVVAQTVGFVRDGRGALAA